MAGNKGNPKGLSQANVERLLAKDVEKAKTKRATKREAAKAEREAKVHAKEQTPEQVAARKAEEAANALKAMEQDYNATMAPAPAANHPEAFHAWLADQGFAPDGTVLPVVETKKPRIVDELHPMYPLVVARRHYVKAKNGNECNGDKLAVALGGLTSAQVVTVLIAALKLESNPYHHLNQGQQSMNLRNKARTAVKNGLLTMAEIVAAIDRVLRQEPQGSRHPE